MAEGSDPKDPMTEPLVDIARPRHAPGIGVPGQPLIDAEPNLPPTEPARGSRVLLGASLVLIAFNLRVLFSSLSAVLPEVIRATDLRPGAASLVTTLPVLCMGLFAPLAPRAAARFGAERTMFAVLGLLTLGTALRAAGSVAGLLAGAVLAGAAIAVGNVLLPGLVKRDFPDRVAPMTGLFTMALSGGAAVAAAATVPIKDLLGGSWPLALGAWALPAAAVTTLWAPRARRGAVRSAPVAAPAVALWRNALAWRVTLFMGLQSALAYCVFGYMAPILRERGVPAGTAGLVVSASVLLQCAACLTAPELAVRGRDQRWINVGFFALALAGLLGCTLAPLGGVWAWAAASGLGQGGLIALAMTTIVLRSPDAATAARLSGMAQGIGYTLASGGPLLVGVLRGATGSYAAASGLFALLAGFGAWNAYGAGRAEVIGTEDHR